MASYKATVRMSRKGLRRKEVERALCAVMDNLADAGTRATYDEIEKVEQTPSRAQRFAEAMDLATQAQEIVRELRDELQEWYDNLPEGFQCGDKGQQLEEAIDALENADCGLDEMTGTEIEFPGAFGQ